MPEVLELLETGSRPSESPSSPKPPTSGVAAYALTIFLSAALLFQVQLIFAKHILPLFGGVPSVWNTCMFCFQVLLLLGYAYAHLLKSRFTLHQQRTVHSVLLLCSAVVLVALWLRWGTPLTPGPAWKPGPNENPVGKILQLLALTVAFPFFMVSTTGPLLQSWAARTAILSSPYRLYALSNAGSLLGLLTYPFVLEWAFAIRHQAWFWAASYLLFVGLCLTIALRLPQQAAAHSEPALRDSTPAAKPKPVRYALWLALSTCSTVILLSATNFLCENIAAIPLLWVLPLSIYLLTFMLAFDRERWYSRKVFWPLYAAAIGVVFSRNIPSHPNLPVLLIALHCLIIFAACMVCHGELARSKPAPLYLTSFYAMIAAGGALGGTFVIVIAPRIFRDFWEFQGALLACGLLIFASFLIEDPSGRSEASAWPAVLVILAAFQLPHFALLFPKLSRIPFLRLEYFTLPICIVFWLLFRTRLPKTASRDSASASSPNARAQSFPSLNRQFSWQPLAALLLIGVFVIFFASYVVFFDSHHITQERNFFGVKYVDNAPDALVLVSGSTAHGQQFKDPARQNLPSLYYSPDGGVGTLLRTHPRFANEGHLRIGVIGMGVASLAAYARPGDLVRYYEIDPAVVRLSVGQRPVFTFLQHSLARVEIVLGDARLSLEHEATQGALQRFDVLVVDAFNSDSIPVHLLTQQAVALYSRHLRGPDSVLAFDISNNYLDLAPVLRGIAETRHLAIVQVHRAGSNWILLSANPAMLQAPGLQEVAMPPATDRPPLFWTDDYSNVFQVFRGAHL
jgi:hypothetical protein